LRMLTPFPHLATGSVRQFWHFPSPVQTVGFVFFFWGFFFWFFFFFFFLLFFVFVCCVGVGFGFLFFEDIATSFRARDASFDQFPLHVVISLFDRARFLGPTIASFFFASSLLSAINPPTSPSLPRFGKYRFEVEIFPPSFQIKAAALPWCLYTYAVEVFPRIFSQSPVLLLFTNSTIHV